MTGSEGPGARVGRAVVVGFGVTGRAVSRHLVAGGWRVEVVEDRPTAEVRDALGRLGVDLVGPAHAARADLVVPSPGVAPGHPAVTLAIAAGVPVVSEVELAAAARGRRRLVAVTGTNGKTTVTTLVADMLLAAGIPSVAAGNIGLPLVEAVTRDVDVVVAEVSSFQLHHTVHFRPEVAVWLNLDSDHLDWHPDPLHYRAAKAKVWANQRGADVAVVNAEDAAVTEAAAAAPARVVTFGLHDGDYRLVGNGLRGAGGEEIAPVADLPRTFPHDLANALAATAAAVEAGAGVDACRAVLTGFAGLPHRLELVREADGVRWYDDSKATTPASVLAALRGFESVVLIAGGQNKGLDLGPLGQAADRLRAVVAIGEAAGEVVAALAGRVPVTVARSMADAVSQARDAARPGDAVLLSPGCASFDWYRSYAERGCDFARAVGALPVGS